MFNYTLTKAFFLPILHVLSMDDKLPEDQKEEQTPPESTNLDDSNFENVEHPSPYPASQESSFTPPLPPRRRSARKFLYILGAILVVLIILNFVRTLGSSKKAPEPSPTPSISIETPSPTPEETVEPTPSATPKPTPTSSIDKTSGLDRAKLSVSVQNGSGVTGAAAKASDLLKSLGYNVVSTGNADNSNFTNLTIKVKPASKDYLPILNKDLSSNSYSVGTTSSDLTATASADALVIVGK